MAAPPTFVEWARNTLIPLSTRTSGRPWDDLVPLTKVFGGATIVALGEGVHGVTEPLELRNRLFQFLVQEQGFNAIAIESGIIESRLAHEFVRGGPGDLPTVMQEAFSWGFGRLPQNVALITWLRDYNADPAHPGKVNFYGFDIAGSPGDPTARRSVETSLVAALEYLSKADPQVAATLRARVDAFLPKLRFDYYRRIEAADYHTLTPDDRDCLTAAIADTISTFERCESRYCAAGDVNDYEWGYRAAISARQVDGLLRQMPIEGPSSDQQTFIGVASDLRDRAQADNLEWIVSREGPSAKLFIFAHNFHLSGVSVKKRSWTVDRTGRIRDVAEFHQEPAGTYLRRRFGDRLLTIGNLIGRQEKATASPSNAPMPLLAEPIDSHFTELGVRGQFIVDLRTAPETILSSTAQEHQLGQVYELPRGRAGSITLAVGKAFDAIWYLDTATAAMTPADRAGAD